MTIKASGSLNTTEIVAEWGGSQPNSLSEYYSAGSLVYAGAADGSGNAIPSSGNPINFSDFFDTTKFVTTSESSTTGTVTVPTDANAIYIVTALGGGGGGVAGNDYDSAGGESAGGGGGGGAYAAGVYLTVTAGEDLTISVGSGGSAGASSGFTYNGVASDGGATTVVRENGTTILSAGGGGGAQAINGGVQGPLVTHVQGSGGSVSVSGQVTSGTTTSGVSVSSGTTAAGSAGTIGADCSGDNCRIDGKAGGNSGAGSGGGSGGSSSGSGTDGTDGTNGGGGGGGSAQIPTIGRRLGGDGGSGSINYQFVRIV